MKVELSELAARIAGRLDRELRELVQLDVSSAWPVFRAVADDGREMFVKVTENDRIYARFK